MKPSEVPIVEVAIKSELESLPVFSIGNDLGWFVEWRQYSDEDTETPIFDCDVRLSPPQFIVRSRFGWYIVPDPLHNISRKLIAPTVSILIIALFIHAIEPGLVEWGVLSQSIAGSFSIGPLEYPKLLFIAFPIFLLPLVFRTIANFRDLSKQKKYISSPIAHPQFEIETTRKEVNVTIQKLPVDILLSRARVQVGITVPERDFVLEALGRDKAGQPAPGMSTPLPEKRIATIDEDGTGVGEVTPMQSSNSRAMVLEPMRLMDSGKWTLSNSDSNDFSLTLSVPSWPGTIYTSLIAVHWELYIEFVRGDGTQLNWVQPISMPQSHSPISIDTAPVRSGRAELSNY